MTGRLTPNYHQLITVIETSRFPTGSEKAKFREGPGLQATFSSPLGLAIDNGVLYVVDSENLCPDPVFA